MTVKSTALSTHSYGYPHACLYTCWHTCPPKSLHACLYPCLLACPPACPHTWLHTCLPVCLRMHTIFFSHACGPTRFFFLFSRPSYMHMSAPMPTPNTVTRMSIHTATYMAALLPAHASAHKRLHTHPHTRRRTCLHFHTRAYTRRTAQQRFSIATNGFRAAKVSLARLSSMPI